jgi:hypothetical protein
VPSASLTTTRADYNKDTGGDVTVNIRLNSRTLESITLGGYTLVRGTDYSLNGDVITFHAAYLQTLGPGQQAFTFVMNEGNNPRFTINVRGDDEEETGGAGRPEGPGEPGGSGGPGAPSGNTFADVNTGDWFYNYVMYVVEHGLMNGTGVDFEPNLPLNRAMVVTVLYRMAGSPGAGGGNSFGDVAGGTWYSDSIDWAAAHGIALGYGNGFFGPMDNVTREDLAVLVVRCADFTGVDLAAEREYPGFSDGNAISGYAADAVERCYKAGIINGMPDGSFSPKGHATRAEFAAMIYRLAN